MAGSARTAYCDKAVTPDIGWFGKRASHGEGREQVIRIRSGINGACDISSFPRIDSLVEGPLLANQAKPGLGRPLPNLPPDRLRVGDQAR